MSRAWSRSASNSGRLALALARFSTKRGPVSVIVDCNWLSAIARFTLARNSAAVDSITLPPLFALAPLQRGGARGSFVERREPLPGFPFSRLREKVAEGRMR